MIRPDIQEIIKRLSLTDKMILEGYINLLQTKIRSLDSVIVSAMEYMDDEALERFSQEIWEPNQQKEKLM